ncbi:MAG TPA: hypothetical protein VIF82_05445 [Burkholderiaceae bacterium]|jgi:hypothetical protein
MTIISRTTLFSLLSMVGMSVYAQTVDHPNLKEGDRWVYNVRFEENKAGVMSTTARKWETSISRVGLTTMTLARKPVDSNLPPTEVGLNADWSATRSLNGKNTVTDRPFDFPMQQGKTWKIETVEEKPDPQSKTQKITLQYTVVGWEDVKVPAGTFKALKIEAEGEWAKEFEPRGASTNSAANTAPTGATIVMHSQAPFTPPPVSGRLYKAYWYVPAVKSFVKTINEDQNASGILHKRTTQELESFSVQ